MKILVVGGGGREHAIIKKLKENPEVTEIFALPGNGGIAADATCVAIGATEIDKIVEFAVANAIDYAVVAPDDPLVLGCVDALEAKGIPCFGPKANAAIIEGSKVFSKDLMKKYAADVAKADEVLGKNSALRSGDWLRALVARLYLEKGIEEWGKKYDIVLGGGYLSVRAPYNLSIGEVKYSDLQSIFPFDNTLTLCAVKGRDLDSKFFNTNNSSYFIHYGEYGASVKQNIDPNATYYIVVDSYTSSYAPNRLTVVKQYDADYFARDLLADYMAQGGLTGR